ncbi:DUF7848 domain-containing protein [Streptomyces flavofungini]|uniref:DUF7848 domain-containing protein n=1 Tax=Streptomyces flavofungini TaxID=68200 RepID=UPI003F7F805D
MAKSLVHEVTWRLSPDREPDAEPMTRRMVCVVCEDDGAGAAASSEPFEETEHGVLAAQSWVFAHAGRHPCHHTYREVICRPWRTVMTEGNMQRTSRPSAAASPVVSSPSDLRAGHVDVREDGESEKWADRRHGASAPARARESGRREGTP